LAPVPQARSSTRSGANADDAAGGRIASTCRPSVGQAMARAAASNGSRSANQLALKPVMAPALPRRRD